MAEAVSLDPFTDIVEVGWPTKADVVIIRAGYDLLGGSSGRHRAAAFRRHTLIGDPTALWPDAQDEEEWVGYLPDTEFTDPPPESKYYYDDQLGEEIPLPTFPLKTPSTDQWGSKEDDYVTGTYLWHTGWAGLFNEPTNHSCLVNARKLRHDYTTLELVNGKMKRIEPPSMGVAVGWNTIAYGPSGSEELLCEFAAYRFEPGYEGNGDFSVSSGGLANVNSATRIARKLVKPNATLLPAVSFTYDFKKKIEFSGGTEFILAGG